MPEMSFKAFFTIIRMLAVILLVIGAIWLFADTKAHLEIRELEYAVTDLAEGLSAHGPVENFAVFKAEELNVVDETNQEPFVRHCKFGYNLEIQVEQERTCRSDDECQDYCQLFYGTSAEYQCEELKCECKKDS